MAKKKRQKKKHQQHPTFNEMLKKIDPGEVPEVDKPETTKPSKPAKFSFSFRFFKQIKYFGLSNASTNWFVALLERMRDISKNTVDEFLEIAEPDKGYRFHPINWDQPNIPIQQDNLDWVDTMYLNENYPIYQIAISAGRGRVAGFLDENNIFNVILFDYDHNLQPMRTQEYRVDENNIVLSEYDQLLTTTQNALRKKCDGNRCGVHRELVRAPVLKDLSCIVVCKFSEENIERTNSLIEDGTVETVEEIYQAGIAKLLEVNTENGSDTD